MKPKNNHQADKPDIIYENSKNSCSDDFSGNPGIAFESVIGRTD